MVTILFNNGAKTFKKDVPDSHGLSDYKYLVEYLEGWVLNHNKNLDTFYNYKVKNFARKLASKGYLLN